MRLQTSCTYGCPYSYPLLDSRDPSKAQSTVGTVLDIYYSRGHWPSMTDRQPGCVEAHIGEVLLVPQQPEGCLTHVRRHSAGVLSWQRHKRDQDRAGDGHQAHVQRPAEARVCQRPRKHHPSAAHGFRRTCRGCGTGVARSLLPSFVIRNSCAHLPWMMGNGTAERCCLKMKPLPGHVDLELELPSFIDTLSWAQFNSLHYSCCCMDQSDFPASQCLSFSTIWSFHLDAHLMARVIRCAVHHLSVGARAHAAGGVSHGHVSGHVGLLPPNRET